MTMNSNEMVKTQETINIEVQEQEKPDTTYVVFQGLIMSYEEYKEIIESMKN